VPIFWVRLPAEPCLSNTHLIAAYAVVNDAIILNSDRDFDYIADATGGTVRQQLVSA